MALQFFPGGSDRKEPACRCRGPRFNPRVREIPWRREWLPPPVFLPGEFHRQRTLAGYSPRGHKDSDTTGRLTLSLSLHAMIMKSFLQFQQSLVLPNMNCFRIQPIKATRLVLKQVKSKSDLRLPCGRKEERPRNA